MMAPIACEKISYYPLCLNEHCHFNSTRVILAVWLLVLSNCTRIELFEQKLLFHMHPRNRVFLLRLIQSDSV